MTIRDEAIIYVHNSQTVKNMFLKVKSEDRDDLRSYLYEILLEKSDKLVKAYQEGWLDFLIWRIIDNQYNSNTSPYRRKIKSYGLSELNFDIPDSPAEDNEPQLTKIEKLITKQHWFDYTLFKMYFYENLTYKQIEQATNINYLTVRRSVMKVLDNIKKEIKIDDCNN